MGVSGGCDRPVQPGGDRIRGQQEDRCGTGLPSAEQRDCEVWEAENAGVSQRQGVSVQQQAISANASGLRDQRQHEQAGIPV